MTIAAMPDDLEFLQGRVQYWDANLSQHLAEQGGAAVVVCCVSMLANRDAATRYLDAEVAALRKDSDLLSGVLAHSETAAEELEDAAAGDGTPRGNLERRIAGLTQRTPHGRLGAA